MITEWLKNIEFAHLWVLALLFLVPVIGFEYFRKQHKQQASMLVTTTNFLVKEKSLKVLLRNTPVVLQLISIALIIVALARPREKFTESQTSGEGIDIVLCFDISGSMNEKDFQPSRVEAAKAVASDFVTQRTGDRIGVTIFSSVSYTLCPVTSDLNMVLKQIQNIQSGYLTEEGTAIGAGLATSVDRLRNSKAKSKIVILLTDGVDIGGAISPDVARDMAKMYGIKVYTIGIGSEKEIEDVVNTPLGPVKQKRKLEFNEGLLQDIAQQTGGQYFHASDNNVLTEVYKSINQLEKSKIEITTYSRYTDRYLPVLLLALFFLLTATILRYTVFRRFP
ncbi:MAG: VWA domain-containing protein [Chitinophagaceae bacterium]|jgi:Ca-activated chloride channel family protein|nr:VWA domain-containing protein [Chitinophagaceae bacterium]